MNIYLLNATLNGKLLFELLSRNITLAGMIILDESGKNSTNEYYDYSELCEKNKINCIRVKSYGLNADEDRQILEKLKIDLLIVASWQRLIPEWLIKSCTIGVIGAHGSHEGIERGRGRSPQNWALLTGKRVFSLSIFWIEIGTDNGNVIDTVKFEYTPTDTILTSYVMVNMYKADMILRNIQNGRITRKEGTPQKSEGLYLPKRTREDGQIDWNRSAVDIYNFVRALTKPYPGAWTMADNVEFVIWTARPVICKPVYINDFGENGTVVSILGESFLVKCGSGFLLVDECANFEQVKEGMTFFSADYNEQMKGIIDRHVQKYGTPLSRLVLDEVKV